MIYYINENKYNDISCEDLLFEFMQDSMYDILSINECIYEYNNIDYVNESATDIKDKVIKFFKDLWEKIKKIFNRAITFVQTNFAKMKGKFAKEIINKAENDKSDEIDNSDKNEANNSRNNQLLLPSTPFEFYSYDVNEIIMIPSYMKEYDYEKQRRYGSVEDYLKTYIELIDIHNTKFSDNQYVSKEIDKNIDKEKLKQFVDDQNKKYELFIKILNSDFENTKKWIEKYKNKSINDLKRDPDANDQGDITAELKIYNMQMTNYSMALNKIVANVTKIYNHNVNAAISYKNKFYS